MRGETERPRSGVEHLRDRSDQIDLIRPDEAEHGAGAEDEHRRDDRHGNHHRSPDGAGRVATLARDNRRVLETAKRAEPHLPENIQVEQRERRQRQRKGLRGGQRPIEVVGDGQSDNRAEQHENQHPAGVVHPLADGQAAHRDGDQAGDQHRGGPAINGLCPDIQRASGPSAYERYVVTWRPSSDEFTIT